jgi:hypothetical protein
MPIKNLNQAEDWFILRVEVNFGEVGKDSYVRAKGASFVSTIDKITVKHK